MRTINFDLEDKMSKETQNNELSTDKALHIADVGGSIFFNVPVIAYEKTRLKLSKDDFEEFKTKTFTSERAFFIWNKLPKDTRPELEFFMEWFYDDVHCVSNSVCEHDYVYKILHDHTAADVCTKCGNIKKQTDC